MKDADMPAYPIIGATLDGNEGLTKREHFAGLAMQGFISAGHGGMPNASELANYAVRYADALLTELN